MSIRRTDLLIDVGRMLFGCLCTVIDFQILRINHTQLSLPVCMFLLWKRAPGASAQPSPGPCTPHRTQTGDSERCAEFQVRSRLSSALRPQRILGSPRDGIAAGSQGAASLLAKFWHARCHKSRPFCCCRSVHGKWAGRVRCEQDCSFCCCSEVHGQREGARQVA